MLKIHTCDGQTHRVDLADEEQARLWLPRLARADFQATIKGVSLVQKHSVGKCSNCGQKSTRDLGVQYSVPSPEGFRKTFFNVEMVGASGRIKGGERVILFADNMCLALMAHYSQPATRVLLTRMGRQRYNPIMEDKSDE